MQQVEPILIIADNDTIYGVEHGYYPSLRESLEHGNLRLVSYEKWRDSSLRLQSNPLCNGEDIYILNPYSHCYVWSRDIELPDLFCTAKSHAIKEALVRMGAKHITLKEEVKDTDELKSSLKAEAKGSGGGGSLNTKFNRFETLNIKTCIESHDPERTPVEIEKVEEFLITHGLSNDTQLALLADRLTENGKLSGHEKYEIFYLNEVQSALNILANIDYKVFSGNLDFSLEHNRLHTFSKQLVIDF